MKHRNILVAIIINMLITLAEISVGLFIGSLALVSDAVHNFSDAGALGLSWWGEKVKERGNNKFKTYGYKRAEILIALFNSLILLVVVGIILFEAAQRLFNLSEIAGSSMISTALVALFGNGIATFLLEKDAHKNLNMKSAWLHSLQDAMFSLGVAAGAVFIYFFHWYAIDPLISIFLSVYVIKEVYELLRQSLDILMEGVPSGIDFEKVKEQLEKYTLVKKASDIHIWQTDSNSIFLSAHLEIENAENGERNGLLCQIQEDLIKNFNINHTTIQMVSATEAEKNKLNCNHCN